MSIQFKPKRGEDSYDLAATMEHECFKVKKYANAKDWKNSMLDLDKEWAKQGEP